MDLGGLKTRCMCFVFHYLAILGMFFGVLKVASTDEEVACLFMYNQRRQVVWALEDKCTCKALYIGGTGKRL